MRGGHLGPEPFRNHPQQVCEIAGGRSPHEVGVRVERTEGGEVEQRVPAAESVQAGVPCVEEVLGHAREYAPEGLGMSAALPLGLGCEKNGNHMQPGLRQNR